MNETLLTALLAIFVPSGVAFGLATWLFRHRSQQQQRQLRTLYAVAESMISVSDMAEIYRRIVHTLQSMLQASNCYLLLHNRVSRQLDVLAGTDRFPLPSIPMDAVSGEVSCFKNKALLEAPDAAQSPFAESTVVKLLGQKALLFVPMVSEGEVIGVLEIDDRHRRRTFSQEQKACAQHVANLGALAMRLCEQRSMREQLYRTEKMAAVGELIAGVAHDLKNPLASITALTELALARPGDSGLGKELRDIHKESELANSILQRLISFARPQKPGAKVVEVNAVLRSVAALRGEKWRERGIQSRIQLAPESLMVRSDPAHVEQVFLNLLITAERAMEQAREKVITIRTALAAKRVLISITDTGPGLAAHVPLNPRKTNETAGLGLAVCQSLIEAHGGSIRVRTGAGLTTTFEIEYPLAAEEPEREPAAVASEAGRAQESLTALVIDEDRKVQESLLSLLSDRQYRVIAVGSAEEALDLAARAHFDLALCDVRLRGMGGIELYRRLQRHIHSFVFLTSDPLTANMKGIFSEHGQSVLAKPFSAAAVERLLEDLEPALLRSRAMQAAER